MKANYRRKVETFSVVTDYGTVEKVPMTKWKELTPHWSPICRAIFEVLMEDDFYPYSATFKRPEGFVASNDYWKRSLEEPTTFPLSEARYFIYRLEEKAYFTDAIREFNRKIRKDWLDEKNIAVLGGYLYSFFYILRPVLQSVKKGNKTYLKPMMRK